MITWGTESVLVGRSVVIKGQKHNIYGQTEESSQEDVEGHVEQEDQSCRHEKESIQNIFSCS